MVVLLWFSWRRGVTSSVSFGGIGHRSDARIEAAAAVAFRHFGERQHLDAGGVARGAELLEALAAEVAHRVHRGFKEFARIEFALALGPDLPERRRHRQPAIGVDVDLTNAVPD